METTTFTFAFTRNSKTGESNDNFHKMKCGGEGTGMSHGKYSQEMFLASWERGKTIEKTKWVLLLKVKGKIKNKYKIIITHTHTHIHIYIYIYIYTHI